MDKPTEAQVKKFWERFGFTEIHSAKISPQRLLGYFNDKLVHIPNVGDIEFLGFLFKYAVPKVYDVELLKRNRFEGEWQIAYRVTVREARQHPHNPITDKDPALALFWAIKEASND